MYMSQEMLKLRRFLARFWLSDNQMTIILEIIDWIRWKNYFHDVNSSICFDHVKDIEMCHFALKMELPHH